MKFMVTQKLGQYHSAKKNLDRLKRENKAMNIEKLKQDFYWLRTTELKTVIDMKLLGSLLSYFKKNRSLENGTLS